MSTVPDDIQAGSYQGARSVPVGVIVACEHGDAGWVCRLNGVVSGSRFSSESPQRQLIRDGDGLRLYLWTGFRLRLHKRYVDDYSLNVRNDRPAVFVVYRVPAPGELEPFMVTVSMDEAQKLDAPELRDPDEHVAGLPMPAEIYRWLEEFVLDNYEPRKPKRKRRREG